MFKVLLIDAAVETACGVWVLASFAAGFQGFAALLSGSPLAGLALVALGALASTGAGQIAAAWVVEGRPAARARWGQ